MPVLNPWVQRLLVALLGGTVSSTVIVASAKNRYAPRKRKKRRVRDDDEAARPPRPPRPPIALGTVAKADAAEGFVPSMTWAQWRSAVAARGRALVDGVLGRGGPAVDDNGARIADEVVTADGKRSRPARGAKKSRAGTKRGGKRRRRQQATLFDSAKESLRQVVKEEARKAVDDTVEQTGLKGAVDTIKQAGDKVGETAKDVAQKLKDALPPDADEKIQAGARSLFAGARKQASRLRDSIAGALEAVEADRLREREANEQRHQLDGAVIDMPPPDVVTDAAPAELPAFPSIGPDVTDASADVIADGAGADADGAAGLVHISDAAAPDGVQGLGVDEVAARVTDGVNKLASFLVGPGHPDYKPRRSRRVASGEVVEAKDPGSSSST